MILNVLNEQDTSWEEKNFDQFTSFKLGLCLLRVFWIPVSILTIPAMVTWFHFNSKSPNII